MTTIQDVAAAAGVSKMTVSNVINNKPNVGAATRVRVRAAIEQLNYRPNIAASALSSGRNGFVEIVVQDIDSPFYSRLSRALTESIDAAGMQAIVQQALYSEESERRILEQSSRMFCDAIVLVTHGISLADARRLADGRAIVLIDELSDQQEFCTVNTPNYEGAKAAMSHLLDRGVRHPFVLGAGREQIVHEDGNRKGDLVGRKRLQGVRDALQEHGIALTDGMGVTIDWTYENARRAAAELRRAHPECDGIFAMSDTVAIGAIRGLADIGVRVPDDVRVTGFDGATIGQFLTPSLTTVDVDMNAMADVIVKRLQAQLDADSTQSPAPVTHDIAPFTLRERDSTR